MIKLPLIIALATFFVAGCHHPMAYLTSPDQAEALSTICKLADAHGGLVNLPDSVLIETAHTSCTAFAGKLADGPLMTTEKGYSEITTNPRHTSSVIPGNKTAVR